MPTLDGLSLHEREVLRRAGSHDLGRWLTHTASTRGCVRPVRLTGSIHTVDTTTGEILRTRHTTEMPDGVLYVPCGDRRASVCPPCAETYRADTYQLVKAGLVGGKGVPESVGAHPAVFATLTAPSFGPVHTRVVDRRSGKVRPCTSAATPPVPARQGAGLHRPPHREPPLAGAAVVSGLLRPRPPRRLERLGRGTVVETPTPLKPREPLSAAEARKLLASTEGQHLDALWALLLMLDLRRSEGMFGKLCDDHGLRRIPLHGLRHTCVSLLLALGVHPRVVMEIVGHSAIYGHVIVETQRIALDGLDAQLRS